MAWRQFTALTAAGLLLWSGCTSSSREGALGSTTIDPATAFYGRGGSYTNANPTTALIVQIDASTRSDALAAVNTLTTP